ncbi:RusA family crossover junction endodeoxyribonuclease [Deinococcus yunweiensis]|uniref:RusA family crossover junction endodeoxyribonuclease n=1 Tax=Deinococcus yunweiensis TaxID=367282 RepID=UPI00398E6AE2
MNPFPNEAAARAYLGKITDPAKRQAARAHLVQYGYHLDEPSATVVQVTPPPASSAASRVDEVRATLPPPRPAPPTALQARGAAAPTTSHMPGVLTLTLPWSPSINHYYVVVLLRKKPKHDKDIPWRGVNIIDEKGRAYRKEVLALIAHLRRHGEASTPPGARLGIHLTLCAPTRLSYDIDNRVKAIFDALTHAHVWADDSLIDELRVTRGPVVPGGRVDVVITPLTTTLFEVMP